MKKAAGFRLVAGMAFILAVPLLASGFERNFLLDAKDLALDKRDHLRGPALSSGLSDPRPWSSYNHWRCFGIGQLRLEEAKVEIDHDWVAWPELKVEASGQIFHFSPETDLPIHSKKVMEEWRKSLRATRQVCLYAAFLQYILDSAAPPESLWVLQKVKTENGYWALPARGEEASDLAE